MKIQLIKMVYFSPTGTTKSIIQGIGAGINHSSIELVDVTQKSARSSNLVLSENELLVIGVPVYMGRVPAVLSEWLHAIKANNTPVICVVVYGNRAYDDALLELRDILVDQGCKPVACAAFIGEHSFSSSEVPTAHGRPDKSDYSIAEQFGMKINDILQCLEAGGDISDIAIPGNTPYGGVTKIWNVDFIAVGEGCTECGVCSSTCPVEAIDYNCSSSIDIEKCITCCACIKSCPQNVRTVKPGPVKDATIRLNNLYSERKEPEIFL